MKFFSLFSVAASALVLCTFLPTTQGAAIQKRDVASDCKQILDDARGKIGPLKTQLLEAYNNGDLNDEAYVRDNIVPIVSQISGAVNVAATKITLVQVNIGGKKEKRQVDEDAVAEALASLVKEIVEALEPLLDFLGGISSTLLARLDADLNTIAVGLGLLLGGVLTLVRDLLESLTNALSGLGFLNFLRFIGLLP